MPAFIDMTGWVFHRLVVLDMAPRDGYIIKWNCVCKCGSTCTVRGGDLRSGKTQSCGCLRSESLRERQTGDTNPQWNGGKFNRGSVPYFTRLLWRLHYHAVAGGYEPCNQSSEQMHSLYNQHNKTCADCKVHEDELSGVLQIDHDHKTGDFRDFVCFPCNIKRR